MIALFVLSYGGMVHVKDAFVTTESLLTPLHVHSLPPTIRVTAFSNKEFYKQFETFNCSRFIAWVIPIASGVSLP